MNLPVIGSWIESIANNPATGAFAGAVYGLKERYSSGIALGEVFLQPLQDMIWNRIGTKLEVAQNLFSSGFAETAVNQGLTFLSTPLKYLPGAIGSLVAIASARDWIAGAASTQSQRRERLMVVAAAVGLAVIQVAMEASGSPGFGDLSIAVTQGMAFYYGAKAASLYGHEDISKWMNAAAAVLNVVNLAYFSQQVYGFRTASDTAFNLITASIATGIVLAGARVVSVIFGGEVSPEPIKVVTKDDEFGQGSGVVQYGLLWGDFYDDTDDKPPSYEERLVNPPRKDFNFNDISHHLPERKK